MRGVVNQEVKSRGIGINEGKCLSCQSWKGARQRDMCLVAWMSTCWLAFLSGWVCAWNDEFREKISSKASLQPRVVSVNRD